MERLRCIGLSLALSAVASFGQNPTPPSQDPLMTLMLAQPKIDVDSPVVPTAVFEPPMVRPGERCTYRVTFNALEASIKWPGKISTPPALVLAAGAHGQLLVPIGTNIQPRTSFNYRVGAEKLGQFIIPEFDVVVYGKPVKVPAASLVVASEVPPTNAPAPMLLLKVPGTNAPVFVGQSVKARMFLPSPGNQVQGLAQLQLSGEGFLADSVPMPQPIQPMPLGPGGANVVTVVYEASFTPIRAGKLPVFAQGFAVSNPFFSGSPVVIRGPAVIQSGPPKYTLVDSDPSELSVRPLPREGQLPGFTGAVGHYALDRPSLSSEWVRVGDSLKLTARVRGDGNLVRLVAPPAPKPRDWQVFAAAAENVPPQVIAAQGYAKFSYTLIPLTPDATTTPPIPFSYFDPTAAQYVDLTIPSVPVNVSRGTAPADFKAVVKANEAEAAAEPEPVLSQLSLSPGLSVGTLVPLQQQLWFHLVQVAPGAAFLGLLAWDRRRRFYERYPGLLLRRRARRVLRRERGALERAARSGDASAFAARAIRAMRVACAPHFPAEPRALVGADVLEILPAPERSGRAGMAVRRVFDLSDATQYGNHAVHASELLALRSELERVFDLLEARL